MLTNEDLNLMRLFRTESTLLRTTPVILERQIQSGVDAYTKQPIYDTLYETVNAIVRGATSTVGGVREPSNGIILQTGEVAITFDSSVILTGVKTLTHEGLSYVIVSITPKGIGTPNRYECIVRRAT